jgi:hypothetical protein
MVHTEQPPALPHLSRHADHTHLHHEAWHRDRERRTTWQLSWLDDPDDGGEDDDENGDS